MLIQPKPTTCLCTGDLLLTKIDTKLSTEGLKHLNNLRFQTVKDTDLEAMFVLLRFKDVLKAYNNGAIRTKIIKLMSHGLLRRC